MSLVISPELQADNEPLVLEGLLPQPSVAAYLVNDTQGDSATAQLTVQRGRRADGDRLMVRVFDTEENLSFWQYSEPGRTPVTFGPGDHETWGIPLADPAAPKAGELLLDADLPLGGKGVHQVRLVAGARNSSANLALPAGMGYGLSFQNGTYSPWKHQPETLYVYVPPHAEVLELRGGPIRILDQNGALLLETKSSNLQERTSLAVEQTGVVWKVEFPNVGNWRLRAAGFPFILCSSPEAARAIHGSVEVLPDGTVVSWKFQRQIAELLPELLAPENVGDADELVVPLTDRLDAWMENAERNAILVNPYGLFASVERALREQNVDPASHWGGSMDGWNELQGKDAPENRWDRLRSVPGLWAGASKRNGAAAENLAEAALLDVPFNPYYGKRELLYRATASALRDLMTLGEDETWRGVSADLDPYPGFMAFAVAQKTFPVYALAAQHMPENVREVWTEALRHIVDRLYPEQMVTTRNQSSHYLLAWQLYADGSGEPRYQNLADSYALRFVEGESPAGYYMESTGPDGSYTGMTNWHMAVYARLRDNPAVLDSLRRVYRFFNHTVAPEPDGTMVGGFNFNHRVGEGFHQEQWNGARGILDDKLPEVALWSLTPRAQEQLKRNAERLPEALQDVAKPSAIRLTNIATPRYLYWSEPDTSGVWPALEEGAFIRNFADELVAVKRPGYYAVIYVGKPAPVQHYISGRERFRQPLPKNAENAGGEVVSRHVTPFTGGGLSSFWSPAYGSSIMAMNWTPYSHHGLIAVNKDGSRWWEDYFSTSFELDEKAGSLVVTGKIEGLPIRYTRSYQFHDEELEIALTLQAERDVELKSLVENLPFLAGTVKSRGVTLNLSGEGSDSVSTIVIEDRNNEGVEIRLDEPRSVSLQPQGMQMARRGIQSSRAEIELPSTLVAGETVELRYTVTPKK